MRTFCSLLLLLLTLGTAHAAETSSVSSVIALSAATATGAGEIHQLACSNRTYQAYGATSAGAGAATVVIEASDLPSPATGTRVDWVELGTISLTLSTTRVSGAFASLARWRHVRPYVSAISGTDAAVTVYFGC